MIAAAENRNVYAEFALGLSVAVVALAFAVVPGALRVAGGGVALSSAWLALWGSAALCFGPAAGALRASRPLPNALVAALAGLVVAGPVVIVLARILKAQTHHRPLGAATFAVVAAALVLGAIAVMARLRSNTGRLSALAFLALSAVAGLSLLGLALPAPGSVLDALLVVGIVAASGWLKLPASLARAAKVAGPVLLVAAVVLGVALRSDSMRSAASERAPVLAALLL